MARVTFREFERQLNAQRITNITVESSSDTPGSIHQPSQIEEYSVDEGTIKKLPPELMEEIYEGMLFRRTQVTLVRQVGGTLEVKMG